MAGIHRNPGGTQAPPGLRGAWPPRSEQRDRRQWEYLAFLCRDHAASGSPPLAPEGESKTLTTSDSRPCTGCPEDLIRSQRWTAHPLPARPDSSLSPGMPPRLPISKYQTTSPATSTGPSTPPGGPPVGQTPTVTSDPAPSLHSHYRGFGTTTGRSADMPRDGTRFLTVVTAWNTPSRTRTGLQCRGMSSHVPYRSSRSGSRHLHAGHRLANKREPARLLPEQKPSPRF